MLVPKWTASLLARAGAAPAAKATASRQGTSIRSIMRGASLSTVTRESRGKFQPSCVLRELRGFSSSFGVSSIVRGGVFLMKTPLGSIGPAYANWRNAIAAGEAIYPGEADAASRVPELTQIGLPIGTFCVWRIPGPRRIIDQEREKDRGQEDVKMSELMTKLRARILTLMIS